MSDNSTISGLVVPIRVEALLISAVDAYRYNKFAPPYANFTLLPQKTVNKGPYLSQVALSAPFTGYHTMTEGIHLHWQLPHALRKGTVGDDGQVKMPAVPDRWLVTRLIVDRSTGQTQTPRSWVIESNYVHTAPTYSSTNIPVAPTSAAPQPYRYLGRVYDYAEWQEKGNRGTYLEEPLTATGFGIPDFAACYQNCRNVFGMVDTELNGSFDPQAFDLNYVVCGWYSNELNDPLHGQSINGRENPFGWLFDDLSGTLSPAYTLVQGTVQQLKWNPKLAGGYFPGDDPLGAFVAIGNTAAESLSALINWELRDEPLPHVERVLNALQLGVLPSLAKPGGLALFEETLFNNEFAAQPGPNVWEIHAREGQKFAPVDVTTVTKLAEINATEESRAANALKIETLRQQIFADWEKFMLLLYPPAVSSSTDQPDVNDVYAYVVAELGSLLELVQAAAAFDQRVMSLSQEIWTGLPPEMQLSSRPGERYFQPTDPVLLLSGNGVPAQPPDNANTALCVVTTLLMTAIDFPAGLVPGSLACSLNGSVLPGFGNPNALPYSSIETAYRALLLVSQGMTPALVALLAANGGPGNPASIDPLATATDINEAQAEWLNGTAPKNQIVFNGPTPQGDIVYRTWTIPWYPIALSWRFDLYPLVEITHDPASAYPADTIINKLTYDPEDFDYVYPEQTIFSPTPQQYQGSVLLSSGAAIDLRNQIEQYLRYNDDEELIRILADLSKYPVLAQSISGFRDTLNMLEPAMQLPIADPLATNPVYANFSNVQVHDAVGDQNQRTPQLNFMYNPLCAGKGVLRELLVTDSFGRSRGANVTNLIISETIPKQVGGDLAPQLLLPARLAQGTKLGFQLMSARDASEQMSALPAGQPVCGWVTPNHLDGSLMFYNSDGSAIGSLQPTADDSVLYWLNAPGGPLFDEPIEIALAAANPVLWSFVMATQANGALYVRELIRTFDRTRTWITPDSFQESSPTAVLVGTPMALVQSTFSIKTAGLPEPDQSFAALVADMKKHNPLDRTIHGFTHVKLPVILGSQSELDDGLFGFFLAPDGAPAGTYNFSVFYSDAALNNDPNIVKPIPQTLTVTSAAAEPVRAALLIDPRCDVHAYSGVLPVNTINIPASVYGAALAVLRFTFLTSPVVWGGGPETIMPIPGEGDGIWKWVIRNTAEWAVSDITEPDSNATLQNAAGASEGWLQYNRNTNP